MKVSQIPVSSLINGQPSEVIDIQDRGLQYGDGLFETIRLHQGQPQFWNAHMHRLQRGCDVLKLAFPGGAALQTDVETLCRGSLNGTLKVIVTRGVGQRGYRAMNTQPNRIVSFYPWQPSSSAATNPKLLTICEQRLGINPVLAGIKHLNRLEQVLARAEWDDEFDEGVMLDVNGNVIEGTMSNLFLISRGKLITPELTRCGVAGIMREQILIEAAKLKIPTQIRNVPTAELMQAEEIFVCNSLIGIWPVGKLQHHVFASGPVTQALMHSLGLPW